MATLGEVFDQTIARAFAQQGVDVRARSDNEAYWRKKLANQGTISKPKPSVGEKLERGTVNVLGKLGMSQRNANRIGKKAFSAVNDLTPVGSVTEADAMKRALKGGNYLGAAGHGLLSVISAVPEVGSASKAMFLGVMAKNADKFALKKAEELAAKGADRQQIWDETGWFKGADDKWRFEVPDNAMTLDAGAVPNNLGHAHTMANKYAQKRFGKDMLDLKPGSAERNEINSFYQGIARGDKKALGEDVINHPELYEAYPGARHIGVGEERGRDLNGSWQPDTGVLRLTHTDADKMRSTAAHELQHFVQEVEGFAPGGMPAGLQKDIDAQISKLNAELSATHRKLVAAGGRNSPSAAPFAQEYDRIMWDREALVRQNARDLYRRLAGEVEARNVQTRLDFTPEQRRASPPWTTHDVSEQRQIINFLGQLGGAR